MKQFGYCKVSISPIRKEAADPSEMVSQLLFGEIFTIEQVQDNWTLITTQLDYYQGWIDSKHIRNISEEDKDRWLSENTVATAICSFIRTPWGKQQVPAGAFIHSNNTSFSIGTDLFELMTPQTETYNTPADFAAELLNTPYLWGGKHSFGIDCSGLTQLVYRKFNKEIPRDAYQQEREGIDISYENKQTGDLAFFKNSSGKIHHVGILCENNKIIHASGCVRVDELTDEGIYHNEKQIITHHLHCIKRYL